MEIEEEDPRLIMIKPFVVMSGKHVFSDAFLLEHLNSDQLRQLKIITEDPKHPWMVEHKRRIKIFEDDLEETAQKQIEEQKKKERRRKVLTATTKKIFWNKKNNFQKLIWFLPRLIISLAIGLPILYFFVGITVELLFDYTIKLF